MSPFLVIIFGDVLSETTKLNLMVSLHEEVCIDFNFIYLSLCFRRSLSLSHHSVFPSSLCVSVITVCFRDHCVFSTESRSLPLSLSILLSFSLAYLMDVFVLVN